MKIKEFSINRYGPLAAIPRVKLDDFNLFFGKNEDGKTLTIDALVKMLLGRDIKGFKDIDRVEENPTGFVILENEKKEFKVPEQGNLTSITDLSSSESRNIFIIRNSDLSIEGESELYIDVTDRLTGLRTKEISNIKKNLKKLGKLTRPDSDAQLSDTVEFDKIKSRANRSRKLIESIDGLQKEMVDGSFDELEETAAKLRAVKEKISLQLGTLEDARKRKKYESGKKALEALHASIDELEKLEKFNEGARQEWRYRERDVGAFVEEKNSHLKALKEYNKEDKKIETELGGKKRDFKTLEERKKQLDSKVRSELGNWEARSADLRKMEEESKFFIGVGKISVVLLFLVFVGYIFHPSTLIGIFGVIFLLLSGYSGYVQLQVSKERGWVGGWIKRAKLSLSELDLDADTIEGIYSNIQRFGEEYSRRNDELQELRRKNENLESKINEIRDDKVPKLKKKIREAEQVVNSLKEDSNTRTLDEYSKKLKIKEEHKTIIGEQSSILKNDFGNQGEGMAKSISFWGEKIKELEEYKNRAKDVEFEEKTINDLENTENQLDEEISEINEKMVNLQGVIEEIGRNINEILPLAGEYLHCKTSRDLEEIKKILNNFIKKVEDNTDATLRVMEIFEEIEAEEKTKVSELFGKESPISKYFEETTGGLYKEVTFNQDQGKIEVLRSMDGKVLEAEKLSGGAFDQLYLSIRLALGEKLLKDNKGFFILDDPFIKADSERVKKQIEVLRKISEAGWQVIYFSAKDEIKNALDGDIKAGKVNYVEVQGLAL